MGNDRCFLGKRDILVGHPPHGEAIKPSPRSPTEPTGFIRPNRISEVDFRKKTKWLVFFVFFLFLLGFICFLCLLGWLVGWLVAWVFGWLVCLLVCLCVVGGVTKTAPE